MRRADRGDRAGTGSGERRLSAALPPRAITFLFEPRCPELLRRLNSLLPEINGRDSAPPLVTVRRSYAPVNRYMASRVNRAHVGRGRFPFFFERFHRSRLLALLWTASGAFIGRCQPELHQTAIRGQALSLSAKHCRVSPAPQKSIRAAHRPFKTSGSPTRGSQLGCGSAVGQPTGKGSTYRHLFTAGLRVAVQSSARGRDL
jgi:hypothetical protein